MPKTNGYVPELAARLERDRNLCDGARRCARILAEYTYRRRDGRSAHITVTYLVRGLCRDLSWLGLSEQELRVDKWNICRVQAAAICGSQLK